MAGVGHLTSPQIEAMLRETKDDLLAFTDFRSCTGTRIWSTDPLERLNKEIKRRLVSPAQHASTPAAQTHEGGECAPRTPG